jgi:hypothetical protein
MQRVLTALLVTGLALASSGCARRYYYDYDHDRRRSDRWEHDHRDRDHRGRLDLNSATTRDLNRLPGVSDRDANRIVDNRPYDSKHDLLDRRIIKQRTYNQIEDFVYAGRLRDRRDDDWRDDDRRDYDRSRPYSRDDNRYQEVASTTIVEAYPRRQGRSL